MIRRSALRTGLIVVSIALACVYLAFRAHLAQLEIARSAALRGRLSQIILALNNYNIRNQQGVPLWLTERDGSRSHSWRALVSTSEPDMNVGAANSYALHLRWNEGRNSKLASSRNEWWCTEFAPGRGDNSTSFVAISSDDLSETLPPVVQCVAAVDGLAIGWSEPKDLTLSDLLGLIRKRRKGMQPIWIMDLDGTTLKIEYSGKDVTIVVHPKTKHTSVVLDALLRASVQSK